MVVAKPPQDISDEITAKATALAKVMRSKERRRTQEKQKDEQVRAILIYSDLF